MEVIYGAAALRDIVAIAAVLERERHSLAVEFADDLRRMTALIADQPDAGRTTRRPHTRVLLMRRFHCHVAYRRLSTDHIRIIRVRDARRKPLSWL